MPLEANLNINLLLTQFRKRCYSPPSLRHVRKDSENFVEIRSRGGAVWQLVGLITRRSQVQILFPQPISKLLFNNLTTDKCGCL